MQGKKFSISNSISLGWNISKSNVGFFALMLIVSMLISFIPVFVGNFIAKDLYLIRVILQIAGKVLSIVVYLGLIKISLKFCDGGKGKLDDLLSSFHLLLKYIPAIILAMIIFYGFFFIFLGVSFLLGRYAGDNLTVAVIIFSGVVALIIVFLVWTIRLSLFPYFIVDERQGPIKALKSSFMATKGSTVQLMLFELLLGLINIAGALVLFVGLIITIPIYLIAKAMIYRQLAGKECAPDETLASSII